MAGFKIIPKDKKLLRSSKVRAWLRYVEEAIQKEVDQGVFLDEKHFVIPSGVIELKNKCLL